MCCCVTSGTHSVKNWHSVIMGCYTWSVTCGLHHSQMDGKRSFLLFILSQVRLCLCQASCVATMFCMCFPKLIYSKVLCVSLLQFCNDPIITSVSSWEQVLWQIQLRLSLCSHSKHVTAVEMEDSWFDWTWLILGHDIFVLILTHSQLCPNCGLSLW